MNHMILDLWKEDKEIRVKALLNFETIPEDALYFHLGDDYHINKITDGTGRLLEYDKVEEIPRQSPYWADDAKYMVKDLKDKQIFIQYSGISKAQHTMVTEDILSINGSSSWYPFGISFQTKYWNREVYIHLNKDYVVLNSYFNTDENAWHYKPQEGELFIIALKNYRYKESDGGIIYYYFEEDDQKAKICVNSIEELLNYYEKLYGYKTITQMPIVSLPIDFNAGAYNIDNTVILNRFVFDYEDNIPIPYEKLIHMMGHEIAHNWCYGAEGNWEDWLNETTAEWSSLAFLIENGYEDYIDYVIQFYYEVEEPGSIRTKDGSRPEQVHIKGTLLFYNIYEKYGLDTIKDFLEAFVKLKEKNTENWINILEEKHPHIIPHIIDGLNIELFSKHWK